MTKKKDWSWCKGKTIRKPHKCYNLAKYGSYCYVHKHMHVDGVPTLKTTADKILYEFKLTMEQKKKKLEPLKAQVKNLEAEIQEYEKLLKKLET